MPAPTPPPPLAAVRPPMTLPANGVAQAAQATTAVQAAPTLRTSPQFSFPTSAQAADARRY